MSNSTGHLDGFLQDPNNFLYLMDLQKGQFEFVTTTRSELAGLSFLDQRTLGQLENKEVIPAPKIIQEFQTNPVQFQPGQANYLFHTSFCCSTLLARCLDIPGKNLSLKEPRALLDLAAFKAHSPNFDPSSPGWKNLVNITMFFLSRSFQPGEKILFKPSNGANAILPEILDLPQTGRAVILYNNLENFLISIVHGGKDRIASVVTGINNLEQIYSATLPVPASDLQGLSDMQKMALTWGVQMRFFQHTINQQSGDKVKTLNYTEFLQAPEEILNKLSKFSLLEISERELKQNLIGPAFNAHSKAPEVRYSIDQDVAERENIKKIFGTEISETLAWAKTLDLDFAEGLSNPL